MGLKEKLYMAGAARGVGRATENFRALREARAETDRKDERFKLEKKVMETKLKLLESEMSPERYDLTMKKLKLGVQKQKADLDTQKLKAREDEYFLKKKKEAAEYNASHIAGMYQDNPDWMRDDYDMSIDKDGRASFAPKKENTDSKSKLEMAKMLSTDPVTGFLDQSKYRNYLRAYGYEIPNIGEPGDPAFGSASPNPTPGPTPDQAPAWVPQDKREKYAQAKKSGYSDPDIRKFLGI